MKITKKEKIILSEHFNISRPGTVDVSVGHGPHVWKIRNFVPGRVKPKTYKMDMFCFISLVLSINRIGQGLISSVTEWNIESWCQQPDFQVGQHYKGIVGAHCP